MEFLEIEALRETYGAGTLVLAFGFAIGIVFGLAAERSGFCFRAAVSEWVGQGAKSGKNRSAQFSVTILVALVVTQLMAWSGWIELGETIYWSVAMQPFALLVGGLALGFGMHLAGGCPSRLLVLAAAGNFRAWTTLIMVGLGGYATLRGILAYPRLELQAVLEFDWNAASLYAEQPVLRWIVPSFIGLAALLLFLSLLRRTSWGAMLTGVLIGLCIAALWFVTGVIGKDDFEPLPLASLTFVAPIGESLQYLMTFTGDQLRLGSATVGGVLLGSFLSAVLGGRLRYQGFESETSLLRYLLGGFLMGFGGVTALGCSIGQGLSGLSTGSISSVIAVVSMLLGGYLGARYMNRGKAPS